VGRYRLVENGSTFMVVGFTVATVIAVGSLQRSPYAMTANDIAEGFRLELPEKFTTAFAAFATGGRPIATFTWRQASTAGSTICRPRCCVHDCRL
jgi:hypothetical protein